MNPQPKENEWQTLSLDEAETAAFLAYENPLPTELETKLRGFFKERPLFICSGQERRLGAGSATGGLKL
jgi:hypothetical protein